MTNRFVLSDIPLFKKSFENATMANDCLPRFLNIYTFDSVYKTVDGSIVFDAGGKNKIEIEFFNFNHPLKRTCSIMYWEKGKPIIVEI